MGRPGPATRLCFALAVFVAACTNNPYPGADDERKILYRTMSRSAPKTLDPAVAYSVVDHTVTGTVYDTLLAYDYLARPYRLIPALAEEVPAIVEEEDGRQRIRFRLRPDLLYADDPCFSFNSPGRTTRASVSTSTERAPDRNKVFAQLSTVAPVVKTSSTRSTLASEISSALSRRTAKAPGTLRQRADALSPP